MTRRRKKTCWFFFSLSLFFISRCRERWACVHWCVYIYWNHKCFGSQSIHTAIQSSTKPDKLLYRRRDQNMKLLFFFIWMAHQCLKHQFDNNTNGILLIERHASILLDSILIVMIFRKRWFRKLLLFEIESLNLYCNCHRFQLNNTKLKFTMLSHTNHAIDK